MSQMREGVKPKRHLKISFLALLALESCSALGILILHSFLNLYGFWVLGVFCCCWFVFFFVVVFCLVGFFCKNVFLLKMNGQ